MEWSEGGRGEEGESSSFALGRKENSARLHHITNLSTRSN